MTRIKRSGWWIQAIAAAAVVIAACGGSPTPGTTSKGTLTVGGFNFPESDILAQLYGQALAHGGYDVKYKLYLGTRAVVVPAELIDQTIRLALAKASKEHRLRDALEAGSTLRAAYDRFGVL